MKSVVFSGGKLAGALASNLHMQAGRDVVMAIRDPDTAQEANAEGRLVVQGRKDSPLSLTVKLDAPVKLTKTSPGEPRLQREARATSDQEEKKSKAKIDVLAFQALPVKIVQNLHENPVPSLGVEAMFCCLPLHELKINLKRQVTPLLTALETHRMQLDALAEEAATASSMMTSKEVKNQRKRHLPPLVMCTRGLTGAGKTSIEIAKEVIVESRLEAKNSLEIPLFALGGPFTALGLLREPPLLFRRLALEPEPDASMHSRDVVSRLLRGALATSITTGDIAVSAANALQLISSMGLAAAWLSGMLKAHFDCHDQTDVQALLHATLMDVFGEVLTSVCFSAEASTPSQNDPLTPQQKLENLGRKKTPSAVDPNITSSIVAAKLALSTQLTHSLMEVESVEHQFGQKQYVLEDFKDNHYWAGPGATMEDIKNPDHDEVCEFPELAMLHPNVHHQCVLTTIVGLRTLARKHQCSHKVHRFLEQLVSVVTMRRRGHEMAECILDQNSWSWLEKPPPITPSLDHLNKIAEVQERGGDPKEFDEVVHRMMRDRSQPSKTFLGLDPDA